MTTDSTTALSILTGGHEPTTPTLVADDPIGAVLARYSLPETARNLLGDDPENYEVAAQLVAGLMGAKPELHIAAEGRTPATAASPALAALLGDLSAGQYATTGTFASPPPDAW